MVLPLKRGKSRPPPGPPSPPNSLPIPSVLRPLKLLDACLMGNAAFVLAIDQGTTSTRAILFDAAGQIRHSAQIALTQLHPQPGWVEHDPEEIWWSVVSTCREMMAAADGPIAAIGITNQRETAVRVDGGMAASDWTMQFLADTLPANIERPVSVETTAWGDAYIAGLTRGL